MKIERVNEETTLYTWDHLLREFGVITRVAVLEKKDARYVIDSYLGEIFMRDILQKREKRPTVLINTHHDWDHCWGNGYFQEIVAHVETKRLLEERDQGFRETYKDYDFSEEMRLPNRLFTQELRLGELRLFHSPGHSLDSISIYDEANRVLFVGDNAELPHPSDCDPQYVRQHRESIRSYLSMEVDLVVPAHGPLMRKQDLLKNLEYVENKG